MPTRRPRWTSVAFPRGCGGTATCCSSSSGWARATRTRASRDQGPVLRARPLQPAGFDRGRDRLPRPSIPPKPGGPGRYSCFDHVGGEARPYGVCARVPGCHPLRERGRLATRVVATPRRRICGAMAGSPKTSSSSRSRAPCSFVTPRSTTSRCTEQRFRHGTCGTATWRPRSARSSSIWTGSSGGQRSWCGSTTRTSVMGDGDRGAGGDVGSRAAALRQRVSPRRIQHVRRARHRGVRLGRASRAQARTSGTPGSYEALLHDVQVPAFWLMTADRAVRDTLRVPRLGAPSA